MCDKMPEEYRNRYNLIVFIVLPLCFIIGFFLSTKVALLLNFQVDLKGKAFVLLSFVPLYIMCVRVVHRKLREKGTRKNRP